MPVGRSGLLWDTRSLSRMPEVAEQKFNFPNILQAISEQKLPLVHFLSVQASDIPAWRNFFILQRCRHMIGIRHSIQIHNLSKIICWNDKGFRSTAQLAETKHIDKLFKKLK